MAVEVKLPRLGQGMESGTIVRWLKAEGDTVSKGEPLYELDTDKVTQEVEAESEGVLLKIVVSDGEVDVGTTVGVIGTQDEDVSELLAASQGGNGGSPATAGAAPIESEAEVSPQSSRVGRWHERRVLKSQPRLPPRRPRRMPALLRRPRASRLPSRQAPSLAVSRESVGWTSRRSPVPARTAGSSPRTSRARPRAPEQRPWPRLRLLPHRLQARSRSSSSRRSAARSPGA